MDSGGSGTTLESWDLERCRREALQREQKWPVLHSLVKTTIACKAGTVFISTKSECIEAIHRTPTDFFFLEYVLSTSWEENISPAGANTF